ncbi:alpha/beta hydrolase [Mucilaginibacter sp. KACC 22063]|uniref:alpha/beta hydrolase n=1 Tax=Mucilaginibacter sp. KACC 22063 TaxID=3025666 RepID=UPI0023671362|nr:alpha/beta hydrolase [Mucilaginibacter sp. KACC 22063]WDF53531.1 alpha/beta hydrolase [Mucilaginibacter sp. KACC 22063]
MVKAFLISGLGADYRLFKNIELKGYHVIYADWIAPESSDTLATYATKLIQEYHIKDGDVVIGVSLGGMLTVEVAKQLKISKAILISSIKTIDEAPWYFKLFRRVPVYKIIPSAWMTKVGFLIRPVFGKMSSRNTELFKSMLRNSSPHFIKWAMGAVLHWNNRIIPQNVYHITGSKDLVFNFKNIKGAKIINGGTHIMIYNKAKQIMNWLDEVLKT